MYPSLNPHPIGIDNPITIRAAAALPAGGAWDDDPTEIPVIGFDQITLYLAYDEGAAVAGNGAVDFKIEYSPYSIDTGGNDWFQMSLYSAGAMAAGADIQSREQREYVTYDSTGATVETFVFGSIDLKQTIERMRISARESGDIDNPGTLQIIGVGNSE